MRKIISFLILLLASHDLFGQTPKQEETFNYQILGKYSGTSDLRISSLTIYLNHHNKFESHYNGHYFSDLVEKGTWKLNGDTLILKNKKRTVSKYLVSDSSLCEVYDPLNMDIRDILCLKKE